MSTINNVLFNKNMNITMMCCCCMLLQSVCFVVDIPKKNEDELR